VNTFAKVFSIVGGLVMLVALVAISGIYRVIPLSAQTVEVTVNADYISNDTDSAVTNHVTTTITDAGRNDSTSVVDTIAADQLLINNLNGGSINLTSTETGVNTGIFEVGFDVTSADSAGSATLAAVDGDQIQITYTFETGGSTYADTPLFNSDNVITVDALGPTFGNVGPADASTSNSTTQIHTVDIADAGVGVGATAAAVRALTEFTIGGVAQLAGPVAASADTDFQWTASRTSSNNSQGALAWTVTARDALGNLGTTTQYAVTIDSVIPDLASAVTGDVADTSDDPVVNDAATDSLTGIRLVFDDDLDGDTVDAADFLVQIGTTALTVSSASFHADLPTMVYLTLADALAADAVPTVQIIGAINDSAANAAALGDTVTSGDGIAPAVTVLLTGTATGEVVTNASLVVRVTADEDSTNPTLSGGQLVVKKVNDDGSGLGATALTADSFEATDDSRVWEWTFDFETDGTEDGLYNVQVSITDGTNSGTVGEATADADDAIIFEVDTRIPAPAITYSGDDATTFVNVAFTAEADEYTAYDDDEDSHNTITSLTATVGGSDVTVNSIDEVTFTIAAPSGGYALGDHQLVLTAVDEAGNSVVFDGDDRIVTIAARADFTIALQPGYNLISLPGKPSSSAINDVIGASHPINQVLTYDPAVAGGWLVAERGEDGLFAGTLDVMDTSKAYLVRTTTFESLDVLVPRVSAGEQVLPPTVRLVEGWNLVPVLDITGDLTGTAPTVTAYFSAATIARVYKLDQFGKLVVPQGSDAAAFGNGYWVYVTADTVLVP